MTTVQEHEPLSSEDDDDVLDELVPVVSSHNRGRRTSVSAESMAPSSDKEYTKVIIPKSQEQRGRINAAIHANFLFKSLDDEQFREVVDAMGEKRIGTGEEVITQGGIGDYFYVVEEGNLDVFVSRGGQPRYFIIGCRRLITSRALFQLRNYTGWVWALFLWRNVFNVFCFDR